MHNRGRLSVDEPMTVENISKTSVSQPPPLTLTNSQACLVHIYPTGPSMGRRYMLGERNCHLGRGESCEILIEDQSVSRKHAIIERLAEGYRASDLGSTNGTFINDKQLDGPRMLGDGDYLRIGSCLYRFLSSGNIETVYHEEIHRLTIQDGLTRICNKRALDEFLDREVFRTQRHKRPLSVLMLDIDKFKSINDTYGHLCGDFVLRDLANCIGKNVRHEDMFARYGGEEFCMVLVETSSDEAVDTAERMRTAIENHPFLFESNTIQLTISIGVSTTCGETTVTSQSLLATADRNLYEAKRAGRNRVMALDDSGSPLTEMRNFTRQRPVDNADAPITTLAPVV